MSCLRTVIVALLLVGISTIATAQDKSSGSRKAMRKQVTTARTNIKNGTKLDEAESTMRELLADSANAMNIHLWLTLYDAVRAQYDQLNEKLYLKQESDTALFFTHTIHLFEVLEGLDSLDAMPNDKGVVAPKYRHKHANYLLPLRRNLYNGGGYYLRRHDFATAYRFFEAYISCADEPLFSAQTFPISDLSPAAFYAVFAAYKLSEPALVLRYAPLAMADSTKEMYLLQYLAETYALDDDTVSYRQTLRQGFTKYPSNSYFFNQLARYYSRHDQQDSLYHLSQEMLAIDSLHIPALITMSSILFLRERYDTCIALCDKIITLDASQHVPYINAGLSYYNQTIALSQKTRKTATEQQQLHELYLHAMHYLSMARQLSPEAIDLWGMPLYNIYYNLNMGDEFEELETLLKASGTDT